MSWLHSATVNNSTLARRQGATRPPEKPLTCSNPFQETAPNEIWLNKQRCCNRCLYKALQTIPPAMLQPLYFTHNPGLRSVDPTVIRIRRNTFEKKLSTERRRDVTLGYDLRNRLSSLIVPQSKMADHVVRSSEMKFISINYVLCLLLIKLFYQYIVSYENE